MRINLSFKIAVLLFFLILVVSSFGLYFVYQQTVKMKVGEIKDSLLRTTRITSSFIDGDQHSEVPLKPTGVEKSAYREIRKRLIQIKKDTPFILFVEYPRNEETDLYQNYLEIVNRGTNRQLKRNDFGTKGGNKDSAYSKPIAQKQNPESAYQPEEDTISPNENKG